MGFNYGYEKKKFDSRWKRLEVEYCDAGMSEEQIAAMKEYDWAWFCSQRVFQNHTQPIPCEQYDEVCGQSQLFRKFASLSYQWDVDKIDQTRYGWLASVENELHTPLKKCRLTADDGALSPLKWCTHSAEMVHGGRERGAPGRHGWGLLGDALALAHGFTLDLDSVGVVDDPVTDGISQGGIVQVLVPFAGVILRTEDGGGHLVPGLHQFQHIPGFCLFEWVEQPFIQDEQLFFPELFHIVPVGSVGPGHRDFHQQIRQADVPDGIKAAAGSHAKGAGQVGLSGPGSSQDNDIVCLLEVGTGGQAQDLLPVHPSFRVVLNILDTGGRVCVAGAADEPGQAVAFPGAPLRVYQHGKAILKGHRLELCILQLGGEGFRHDTQAHFVQFPYRFIAQHGHSPLL